MDIFAAKLEYQRIEIRLIVELLPEALDFVCECSSLPVIVIEHLSQIFQLWLILSARQDQIALQARGAILETARHRPIDGGCQRGGTHEKIQNVAPEHRLLTQCKDAFDKRRIKARRQGIALFARQRL